MLINTPFMGQQFNFDLDASYSTKDKDEGKFLCGTYDNGGCFESPITEDDLAQYVLNLKNKKKSNLVQKDYLDTENIKIQAIIDSLTNQGE